MWEKWKQFRAKKNEWNWPYQIVKFVRNSFHLFVRWLLFFFTFVVCLCLYRFGSFCWILFGFIVLSWQNSDTYLLRFWIRFWFQDILAIGQIIMKTNERAMQRQKCHSSNACPQQLYGITIFQLMWHWNVELNLITIFSPWWWLKLNLFCFDIAVVRLGAIIILDINCDEWTNVCIIVCAIVGSFTPFESIFIVRLIFFFILQ